METNLHKYIALDIETSNGKGGGSLNEYDPQSSIALVQLKEYEGEIELLRWNQETHDKIQKYVDDGYIFILHNAMFDASWLLHKHNLYLPNLWDTQIASQVLNAGKMMPDEATRAMQRYGEKNMDYLGTWNPLFHESDENLEVKRGGYRFSHSLQATVRRYAGESLQKDQGNTDWAGTLTEEQRRYAEDDVRYLHKTVERQMYYIEKHGLERVIDLEMSLTPVLVKMKQKGIFVDLPFWRKAVAGYLKEANALEERLNLEMGMEMAERSGEMTLFGTYTPVAFKVSSPAQLANFFGTENADESALRYIDHPLIPDIMKFKELNKLATTYGEGYFKFIQEDGRIYSGLKQADTATGRLASHRPNLQNIPRDIYKRVFVAPEGSVLVWFDYSSVESRILAVVSGDEGYLQVVNSSDIHWNTAKQVYKLPDDAERYHEDGSPVFYEYQGEMIASDELRNKAKGSVFGIAYGISAAGLVGRELAADLDEGQAFLDSFTSSYPTLMNYLRGQAADAVSRGYTQDPVGRIRWYELDKSLPEEEQRRQTSSFSRQAFNMSIQSTSASITKLALVKVNEYLHKLGAGEIVLTIHDSLAVELPKDFPNLRDVVHEVKRLMEDAGVEILPTPEGVGYPVDVEVFDEEWSKKLE